MTAPLVSVVGVTKRYGSVNAVDDVTLDVRAGEIYALLGLNGAGKTTLIRLLLGMIRPQRGSITISGRPVAERAVWSGVGYLVEAPSAYPELTVRENLEVVSRLRKIRDPHAVDRAIALLGLQPCADRRARAISMGNLQRLGLAKAMLHRPGLLVLDEPVNGLDPAGVVEVRTMLGDLAREHGVTVLLSSHLLGEVARVATKIGVLHEGRLVDQLDPDDLVTRAGVRLEVSARDTSAAVSALRAAGHAVDVTVGGGMVLAEARAVQRPDDVAAAMVRAGVAPTRLALVEDDLETYFLRLVAPAVHTPEEVPDAR